MGGGGYLIYEMSPTAGHEVDDREKLRWEAFCGVYDRNAAPFFEGGRARVGGTEELALLALQPFPLFS